VSGTLYVVATPIGNLEDITYRAVRILREATLIAAEDTRHSRKLLEHYAIRAQLLSYHEHNEKARTAELLARLRQGEKVALISDAGTPCIADPGYRLISACQQQRVKVVAIPGACALVAALSIAGLPTDGFHFSGFVPAKKGQRAAFLQRWGAQEQTLVAYETPHRLLACLDAICVELGEGRQLVVARELTKVHEELFRGSAIAAREHFSQTRVKGEIVLLLSPALPPVQEETLDQAITRLLSEEKISIKQLSKEVARSHGIPASQAYARALELRKPPTA
jgi:16S rRNA (cytidine1402-2'-O)-methyltransferase